MVEKLEDGALGSLAAVAHAAVNEAVVIQQSAAGAGNAVDIAFDDGARLAEAWGSERGKKNTGTVGFTFVATQNFSAPTAMWRALI